MSLATVLSRAAVGIEAPEVRVEVHLTGGLPRMNIVGLPETAVRESRDRVRAALKNSGFKVPGSVIIVSLAPADLPKEGGRFDLPIALGVLAASRQIPRKRLDQYEFLGELSLTGEVRPVSGCLPAVLRVKAAGRRLILPAMNAAEAGLVSGFDCRLAGDLSTVCAALAGRVELPRPEPMDVSAPVASHDLSDVLGQHRARRALEVAASGGHNLLFIGPPGTGKTMLAARLPGILPPMTDEEALESAAVASVAGMPLDPGRWRRRCFRAPHHTASAVALVGGGSRPRPGEISLAHHGVLFLDEFPEFERRVLEVLREPMESGRIVISRAALQAEFPARFQLVAAMNPCPCGFLGDPSGRCRCTPDQVLRYRARVSGPLLDRIDLQLEVPRQKIDSAPRGESSAAVRERVQAARERQLARGALNAWLDEAGVRRFCGLDPDSRRLLERACERLTLSARGHQRILKVARTIADLDGAETIAAPYLSEAIGYRELDRGTRTAA